MGHEIIKRRMEATKIDQSNPLRDEFAMAALAVTLTWHDNFTELGGKAHAEEAATDAYRIADAMLKARKG